MNCPKCGGPTWDNRATKRNPKQPDYRCKDKENCDGAIWPEKKADGGRGNGAAPAASRSERPSGPLAPVYGECMEIAGRALKHYAKQAGVNFTATDLVAATATLFIQAAQSGRPIKAPAAKPAPSPQTMPPVPPDPNPEAYEMDNYGSSLPF